MLLQNFTDFDIGNTMRHRLKSSVYNEDILSTFYKEKEKIKPKICFLSGKERELLTGGHSRFHCEQHRDVSDVGPGSYNTDKKTSLIISKAGFGGLASRTPRFAHDTRDLHIRTTHVSRVETRAKKTKKGRKIGKPSPPFGSTVLRSTGLLSKKDDAPGFNYDVTRAFRRREMEFDHSFGGRTKLRPLVLWKCSPENTDVCGTCGRTPTGDYHISGSNILCLSCFDSEWNEPNRYTYKQLNSFKAIRHCSDVHTHDGIVPTSGIITNNRDIRKQRVLESYFASFASPRKVRGHGKCQQEMSAQQQDKLRVLFMRKGAHQSSD